MNNINFTARLVDYKNILKRKDKHGNTKSAKVSFVELDIKNPLDIDTLKETSQNWNTMAPNYSSEIYNDAKKEHLFKDVKQEHYYALTEQKTNFKKLSTKKILGLIMFSKKHDCTDEITWLQARPDTNYSKQKRKYSKIGETLVKSAIEDNPVYVSSSDVAVNFYKKLGFREYAKNRPTCLRLII